MPVEEQVVVIYGGVNGHLDVLAPDQIVDFEKAFLPFMRSNHKDILEKIKSEVWHTNLI